MVTVYELLEVNEKASKEEIEQSYQKLIVEFAQSPSLSEQENQENALILNKLKMAYDILSNDEKRAKYDKQLADKRAEELLKGVRGSSEIKAEEEAQKNAAAAGAQEAYAEAKQNYNTQNTVTSNTNAGYQGVQKESIPYDNEDEEPTKPGELTHDEQIRIQQAAQREFQEKLERAKAVEQEYTKAYNQAYNNYVKKMNGGTKKWTLKKVGIILGVIVSLILIGCLLWIIPPSRRMLTNLYETNDVVRVLVNIVVGIVKAFIE